MSGRDGPPGRPRCTPRCDGRTVQATDGDATMKRLLTMFAKTVLTKCPALPGARFMRPAIWTETDKENFERFLKTPSGAKLLLTLHALVTDRALAVCDRSPYEHGMTGGMSFLLGEIERLTCEGEPVES